MTDLLEYGNCLAQIKAGHTGGRNVIIEFRDGHFEIHFDHHGIPNPVDVESINVVIGDEVVEFVRAA